MAHFKISHVRKTETASKAVESVFGPDWKPRYTRPDVKPTFTIQACSDAYDAFANAHRKLASNGKR